jgi:aspartate oxidase
MWSHNIVIDSLDEAASTAADSIDGVQQQQQQQQQQQYEISRIKKSFDSEIRSVLDNHSLSDVHKSYLCLVLAEQSLYKCEPEFASCQFTVETREELDGSSNSEQVIGRTAYRIRSVATKRRKKNIKHRLGKLFAGLLAPSIGAVISVYFRQCCFPS